MTRILALILALSPGVTLAAGGGSDTPPTPTETTQDCAEGTVYDADAGGCVAPRESSLDDDALYGAARELAYAGRYADTLAALDAMDEGETDRVLTYRGFAHRKMGERDTAMAFYEAALTQNPDNILARSYMGQAFVESGELDLARLQLREIRARGGRETWPDVSLRMAIASGRTTAY